MKTKKGTAVSVTVLLALLGIGSTFAPKPVSAKDVHAVVRFECDSLTSAVGPVDGSSAAPGTTATTCAQTVADYLDGSFQPVSAEESLNDYFSFGEIYTMITADPDNDGKGAHQKHDVLRLVCQGGFVVLQDGSAGAPTITSTTCSQALADALNAKFKYSSGESIFAGYVTAYTFVRTEEKCK